MQTIRFYHAKNTNLHPTSIALWFLVAGLAAPLLAHATIGGYLRFMADDFCSANATRNLGVLNATWYWYVSWTGRYSANLLDSLNGLGGPRSPYHTALALLAWVIAGLCLAARMAWYWPRDRRLVFTLLAALLLPAFTLASLPTVEESLYFGQSMRSVIPPLVLITGMAALLLAEIQEPARTSRHRWLRRLAMVCLAFLSAGFSETAVIVQAGLCAMGCMVWTIRRGREVPDDAGGLLLAGLGGTWIGLAVMVLAPGNAYRQAFFPPAPGLVGLLRMTTLNFLRFIKITLLLDAARAAQIHRWLSLATVWIVPFLLGSKSILPSLASDEPPSALQRHGLWLTPIATAGLVWACFAPAAYGMSANMPGRAFIVPVFATGAGLVLWGFLCGQGARGWFRPRVSPSAFQMWALTGILALLALNSFWSAVLVLRKQPAYAAYAHTWDGYDRQLAEIRTASGAGPSGSVTLEPIINPVFGFSELTSDSQSFINQCMSGYYGIQLRTTAPPVP